MKKFDAITVLGNRPNTKTWQFPPNIYQSLDLAMKLHNDGVAPVIVLSGLYSVTNDYIGVVQPQAECDMMADYLRQHGCPDNVMLSERRSKDTLSNLLYLGREILIPHGMTKILLITVDARVQRLKFLCQKVLSGVADVQVQAIDFVCDQALWDKEAYALKMEQKFLADMPDGTEGWPWLEAQFYDGPLYHFFKEYDLAAAGKQA